MARLSTSVQSEIDRVSQTLTGRICQLAERYATPLPKLTEKVEGLAARVDEHLKKMGAAWKIALGHKLSDAGVIPEEWEARSLPKAARIANGQIDPRMEPYKSMVLVAPDHIESGNWSAAGKENCSRAARD